MAFPNDSAKLKGGKADSKKIGDAMWTVKMEVKYH